MPGPDDELAEEERRQRREQAVDAGDAGSEVAAERTGWCDGCDVPGCDVPEGTGGLVASLVELAVRGYRRWLTRFTPACPSEPSCSAYALAAVTTLGPRRGLRAAARRVRSCGRPACDPR
jgi:putative component of membrane protein insertase Oxa1/YidC/SpoIIIJ protein YidD